MAGRGPAPKGARSRDRDTPDFEELEATAPDKLFGPELPDGIEWHVQTRALWDALRRSPLLEHEPDLGWQFLIDTALMHHEMWTRGKWEFASEVRLRVAKFGATPEDRMRLKVKITTGPVQPVVKPAAVTDISSRRQRLTG